MQSSNHEACISVRHRREIKLRWGSLWPCDHRRLKVHLHQILEDSWRQWRVSHGLAYNNNVYTSTPQRSMQAKTIEFPISKLFHSTFLSRRRIVLILRIWHNIQGLEEMGDLTWRNVAFVIQSARSIVFLRAASTQMIIFKYFHCIVREWKKNNKQSNIRVEPKCLPVNYYHCGNSHKYSRLRSKFGGVMLTGHPGGEEIWRKGHDTSDEYSELLSHHLHHVKY